MTEQPTVDHSPPVAGLPRSEREREKKYMEIISCPKGKSELPGEIHTSRGSRIIMRSDGALRTSLKRWISYNTLAPASHDTSEILQKRSQAVFEYVLTNMVLNRTSHLMCTGQVVSRNMFARQGITEGR